MDIPLEAEERLSAAQRLRLALKMADAGISMMRMNLRRRFPAETDAEVDARLEQWLSERPGAEDGDAWGRSAPERLPHL